MVEVATGRARGRYLFRCRAKGWPCSAPEQARRFFADQPSQASQDHGRDWPEQHENEPGAQQVQPCLAQDAAQGRNGSIVLGPVRRVDRRDGQANRPAERLVCAQQARGAFGRGEMAVASAGFARFYGGVERSGVKAFTPAHDAVAWVAQHPFGD
jgi:hypothetical protein